MYTLSAKLTFRIYHARTLKDKRQVRRSIIDKTKHKFKVAIAEVDTQDIYQTLTIGIAVVSGDFSHGEEMRDEIVRYMEGNGVAELVEVKKYYSDESATEEIVKSKMDFVL